MTESLTTGTYEILRNRLRQASSDLRERFDKLNAARASVFGHIETKLGTTAHVSTDHNCVPRDLLSFGDQLLLGYNVQFGLKSEISCEDVFSLYRLEGDIAHSLKLDSLLNANFRRDFEELYRYYKNTSFSRFFSAGPIVYFVFQVGKQATDVKAFKWAIEGNQLRYIDNRSDQEVKFPAQHAFAWQRATRDLHRSGVHPHISIQDIVFVECVGGDLTIKVEDNTEEGSGIYAEPVDNADQTLDDAEIYYCVLGNLVLLKMRPYQEKEFRYFVFSSKRQQVTRLDAISRSCVLLPDDHGIIFPGGMFLQTGSYKLFDQGHHNLVYARTIAAPNGEDFLYLFTDPESGLYLHLRYNLIRQEVDTPLVCHGQAFFDDGSLVTFRGQDHPQKHHALQMWQTPFVGPNFPVKINSDSMLYKIGNRELVRGMAECQELLQLIDKDDSYDELYMDLVKGATDILDSYFWLDRPETMQLSEPIQQIRDAAAAAVEEFDKVVRVRRETQSALQAVARQTDELVKAVNRAAFDSIEQFVEKLAAIREQRGHAIGLRERPYVDVAEVEPLERQLAEVADRLGHRCVQFLLNPKSLVPYQQRMTAAAEKVGGIKTAAEGRKLQEQLATIGQDLELLIETVSQLKIDDLTQRTTIVDQTGNLLAELNRIRSTLKSHVRNLLSGEMEADFASQTKLLDQATAGALETADTPEKVDEAQTRLMLQLEELEGRFAEFDELLVPLTEKRQALYEAFEARRQNLVEARAARAESLAAAAERLLQGIQSRSLRLDNADALRSYLASDPMVDKVRQIADQLQDLGDSVRMEDLRSKLKSVGDDSLRQLRDRQELYTGEDGAIQLGRHQFSVNRQPVELTCVVRGGKLQTHLTGTQFFQDMSDPSLDQSRDLWQQLLPSESAEVYRAEFLAAELLDEIMAGSSPLTAPKFLSLPPEEQQAFVRRAMQGRHQAGYSRGVHDRDAAQILANLLRLRDELGWLRYAPQVRGMAWFSWNYLVPLKHREETQTWIDGIASIAKLLPNTLASQAYVRRLMRLLRKYGRPWTLRRMGDLAAGADFLFEQLRTDGQRMLASPAAVQGVEHMREHLPKAERERLQAALAANQAQPIAAWTLALDAVDGYLRGQSAADPANHDPLNNYRHEMATLLLSQEPNSLLGPSLSPAVELDGLVGDHPRLQNGRMLLHYHEFVTRLGRYRREVLPRYQALREAKHRLLQAADRQLKTAEFKPRVLTSFVRNQLIDEVYLPLIGDNLAKQLGASGEGKRTDRMGLLLLISPPGYGKTTLMEYIANRLGLVFVKINGPALGHAVTSLDPAEAGNASAREEVKRINMGLEMGDNVMLYLDDIQHCSAELLQKFIPLCDSTRKIDGVWNGESKAYDLRGRKFAVVMAGNPYTESGDRFQIPDMLANRADVYNLGEMIGDAREAFELSYIENCLTSNPELQPLSRATSHDQRAVIRAAERGTIDGLELESNLSPDQLQDMLAVLVKLNQIRDIVLKVNRAYIRSAAQQDAYRTEPPFKLQGSYRNMNRIAERVSPLMNQTELRNLILSNYEQDAQTLTRDGESSLLKFKELLGTLNTDETQRWESIKFAYMESVRMQGIEGEDSTAQVLRSLTGLRDGLESIRRTMVQAISGQRGTQQALMIQDSLSQVTAGMAAIANQVSQAIANSSHDLALAQREIPEQKVLVQHSVPRVMTDLVRSQFQLLYDGLRPVLESSSLNASQLDKLRASIDDCLGHYRSLQKEIDASESE